MMTAPTVATEQRAEPVYLRCHECSKPIAEVRDGHLIVKVRHHGEMHLTVIPLARLVELMDRAA